MTDGGRREDARLVTGEGRFTADVVPDGALIATFVRSSEAHGVLREVDVTGALVLPGVVAVLVEQDLGLRDIPSATGAGPSLDTMTRPCLARGKVRFVGEPIAVVLAEDAYRSADAAEAVTVDIEPLPVASDLTDACADRSLLFEAAGTNTLHRVLRGGVLPDAPVVVELDLELPRLSPFPIEPLVAVAVPGDGGHVMLRCAHQTPHRLRRIVAEALGARLDEVDVVVGDVGGGFGLKGMIYPEYLVVAAAARRLGRPVVWTQTRSEQLTGGTHGRAQRQRVRLAGSADGELLGLTAEIVADVGAYPHNGAAMPLTTTEMLSGAYALPSVGVDLRIVVTNRAPTGAYRGAGRPEATYAVERAVDAYARAVGLDPFEVRRRNAVPASAQPYRSATGQVYDGGDYAGALALAAETVDLPALRREQADRRRCGADPLGVGVALFVERSGGRGVVGEHARLSVERSGRLVAAVGTCSTGQGHETVWADVVAEAFGVEAARVEVRTGDTRELPDGVGSFGSRSAQAAGGLLHELAVELRGRTLDEAAQALETARDDLETTAGGQVTVRGDPTAAVGLGALAEAAEGRGEPLLVGRVSALAQAFPYGAHVAVVEVDVETGAVRLRRLVAVDDCGRVLDERVVEGQLHGSVAQGVAAALYEQMVYDPQGQPLTSTAVDYTVPAAPDLIDVELARLETPAPGNPLGVKGVGEAGCIGMPAAVVNAVLDALVPLGVTALDVPLTPARMWAALQAAQMPEATGAATTTSTTAGSDSSRT